MTTFFRHTQTDQPVRRIGRQDITAQVDIARLVEAGRRAGVESLGLTTQGRFLVNLGLARLRRRLAAMKLPQRQMIANAVGMLDLGRPGGLGDFRVLAQGKNVGHPSLWGFRPSPEAAAIAEEMPVPMLTEDRPELIEARYPHTQWEFEGLWPFPTGSSGEGNP